MSARGSHVAESPRYYFIRHARNRMRRDRIPEADAIKTIEDPDHVEPEIRDRVNVWKLTGASWLKVTYVVENETAVIITVTLKRKGPQGR